VRTKKLWQKEQTPCVLCKAVPYYFCTFQHLARPAADLISIETNSAAQINLRMNETNAAEFEAPGQQHAWQLLDGRGPLGEQQKQNES
jgi:hypothetical protein